ncbi:MAG: DSD1 family PLP-dependent enzyme [Gemmatimonadetes bacterium]|nr:DSD1 family PLP-dependent enzyme [Gemmatimonadota bacterium]
MTPTHFIGQHRDELDTPVLLVDLDILDRNIARMARVITKEAGVRWRPHTKGMKSPALAHYLQRAGAQGVTCAKLAEAEIMAAHGIQDILVANQVVGPIKADRLARLQQFTRVTCAVDSVEGATALGRAAIEHDTVIPVLIEIDTGIHRSGTQPGEATVRLAEAITQVEGIRLMGLMTWEAMGAQPEKMHEKKQEVARLLGAFTDTAEACRQRGFPIEILSCGGTVTYWMSAFHPGITEIQAGGGIYGDMMYRGKGVDHEPALTVMTTVTSRHSAQTVTTDGGRKSMSMDLADPQPIGIDDMVKLTLSAEHAIVDVSKPRDTPGVGDHLEFIAGYSDTTVFLHNHMVGTRQGIVEVVWPILGRGHLT